MYMGKSTESWDQLGKIDLLPITFEPEVNFLQKCLKLWQILFIIITSTNCEGQVFIAVCLSVSNITEKQVDALWSHFQDMLVMMQETVV